MANCKCGKPGHTIQLPPIRGMKGLPGYEVVICKECMQKAMTNTMKKIHGSGSGC